MFGLEGSGFIISVGFTLLIAGTIIYYVNNRFKENTDQMQTILQILQEVNSCKQPQVFGGGGHANAPNCPVPGHVPGHIPSNAPANAPGHVAGNASVPSNASIDGHAEKDFLAKPNDLISVSDNNSDSEVSSTTTEEEIFETNNNEITDSKLIDITQTNNMDDNETETSESDDCSEPDDEGECIKNVELETATGGELDNMLLNIIDIHKKSAENDTENLNDMKLADLRQMIKNKGVPVNNLGKMKKGECIELLSK